MANTIIGRVHKVGRAEAVRSKDGTREFTRRELVLDASTYDRYTGERRANFPAIEFGGKACGLLDPLRGGDLVEASFVLSGAAYTDRDGAERYFTRVRGYAVRMLREDGRGRPQEPARGQERQEEPASEPRGRAQEQQSPWPPRDEVPF